MISIFNQNYGNGETLIQDWTNALQMEKHNLLQLLHNPKATLRHAQQSLIDQISQEICHPSKELNQDKSKVFLKYLSKMVQFQVSESNTLSGVTHFELRITATAHQDKGSNIIFAASRQKVDDDSF